MAISVTDFTLAAPSGLTVTTATLAALDTSGAVTAGVITESATPPVAGDASWIAWNGADGTRPAGLQSKTLTAGAHTLYGHVKDGAGNRGSSAGRGVTVSAGAVDPAFVAAGTSGTTPAIPAGIVTDDVLFLVAAASIASVSGWTKLAGGTQVSLFALRKTAAAVTAPALGAGKYASIAAFRGLSTAALTAGNAIDAIGSVGEGADNATAPGITTTAANDLVLFAAGGLAQDSEAPTWSLQAPASGPALSQASAWIQGGVGQTKFFARLMYGIKATAGATGSETTADVPYGPDGTATSAVLVAVKAA